MASEACPASGAVLRMNGGKFGSSREAGASSRELLADTVDL